jgi:hypothetical protein
MSGKTRPWLTPQIPYRNAPPRYLSPVGYHYIYQFLVTKALNAFDNYRLSKTFMNFKKPFTASKTLASAPLFKLL